MASPFEVEFSMRQPPSEAQANAVAALAEPARIVGLRLTKQSAGELQYKPRVQFPFLLMLWHNLQGEQMKVRFSPGADGGSQVTINGAVARGVHPLAADPGHWTEALGD
jgi:hypothetical protein